MTKFSFFEGDLVHCAVGLLMCSIKFVLLMEPLIHASELRNADISMTVAEDFDFYLFLKHRIDDLLGISEKKFLDNNTANMAGLRPQLIY